MNETQASLSTLCLHYVLHVCRTDRGSVKINCTLLRMEAPKLSPVSVTWCCPMSVGYIKLGEHTKEIVYSRKQEVIILGE